MTMTSEKSKVILESLKPDLRVIDLYPYCLRFIRADGHIMADGWFAESGIPQIMLRRYTEQRRIRWWQKPWEHRPFVFQDDLGIEYVLTTELISVAMLIYMPLSQQVNLRMNAESEVFNQRIMDKRKHELDASEASFGFGPGRK